MEPVLGGRDDGRGVVSHRCSPSRRNGARPWRTGRRPLSLPPRHHKRQPQWSPSLADGTTFSLNTEAWGMGQPQWSPSLADGTTRRLPRGANPDAHAAMEPVLGGRDDVRVACLPSGAASPQWSPSLADGTTTGTPTWKAVSDLPQWSPSLADGTTPWVTCWRSWCRSGRNGARPWRTGRLRA